jgi:hypothetical protein
MKTNALRTAMRNLLYQGVAYTPPTQWWMSVYSTDPGSGLSDAIPLLSNRVAITGWQNVGDYSCSNSNLVELTNNTGNIITLSFFSIHDAQTGGRTLHYGRFNPTFILGVNEVFSIPPGSITVVFRS